MKILSKEEQYELSEKCFEAFEHRLNGLSAEIKEKVMVKYRFIRDVIIAISTELDVTSFSFSISTDTSLHFLTRFADKEWGYKNRSLIVEAFIEDDGSVDTYISVHSDESDVQLNLPIEGSVDKIFKGLFRQK